MSHFTEKHQRKFVLSEEFVLKIFCSNDWDETRDFYPIEIKKIPLVTSLSNAIYSYETYFDFNKNVTCKNSLGNLRVNEWDTVWFYIYFVASWLGTFVFCEINSIEFPHPSRPRIHHEYSSILHECYWILKENLHQ